MDMAEDDDGEKSLIVPCRSCPWTLKRSRRSLVLSWSRGGAAGTHARLAEPCWLHALSQAWVHQYAQTLTWDFILLGIFETWGNSYSLPHRDILGEGTEGLISHVTLQRWKFVVCSPPDVLHPSQYKGEVLERNNYLIFPGWVCLKAE